VKQMKLEVAESEQKQREMQQEMDQLMWVTCRVWVRVNWGCCPLSNRWQETNWLIWSFGGCGLTVPHFCISNPCHHSSLYIHPSLSLVLERETQFHLINDALSSCLGPWLPFPPPR
jgi:hypothetical protein